MFKGVDWNSVYSVVFTIGGIVGAMNYIAKHTIQRHTEELKDSLQKIMYALYNDGQTGLVNKVDTLIESQQQMRVDVEVLKTKMARPRVRK
jgi:hypothetical protein